MIELVVYPDAHPEVTSVDGYVQHKAGFLGSDGMTWADLLTNAGIGGAFDDEQYAFCGFQASTTINQWNTLIRSMLLFDTSSIPVGAIIVSAILSLYGAGKFDTLSSAPTINVFSSLPASDTQLVTADFLTIGDTSLCDTDLSYADFDITDFNNFTFNASGKAAITKAGITKLAIRNVNYDLAAIAPPWVSGSKSSYVYWYQAKEGGGYRPKLTITYRVRKGNIHIDQLKYQHVERMQVR